MLPLKVMVKINVIEEAGLPLNSEISVSGVKVSSLPDFPIVGIGASAGGLEALEQFFGKMPIDSGMAFVIIQHLDPNHPGIMPELLQRITKMKVFQATEKLKVKPNCLYVIPPNKSMSLFQGALYLFSPSESRGLRLPVDTFFKSLADDKREKSIGIILSGMGSDGSLGLKAIQDKNGMVFVQEPVTAKYDGMPLSAMSSVKPDGIASASDLPEKLISLLKSMPIMVPIHDLDEKTKSNLDRIILLLREKSGHDFSLYKKNTLFRRIERRKGVHQIEKISGYVRYLQENPQEAEILYKELLIGVTSFFRDAPVWEKLKESVLPDLVKASHPGTVLRAWVAACSTGEEAYSLAMTFKEVMDEVPHKNITLQVFATDLDTDAIDFARKGNFGKNIASEVSQERLERFFVCGKEGYRVNASIREMVVFAPHDVIKDPPFTRLDFLSCRNLLIYMEPVLQKKLISLFHYVLNPGGVMVLGTAENTAGCEVDFETIHSKLKIYRRSSTPVVSAGNEFPGSFGKSAEIAGGNTLPPKKVENIQSVIDQLLLQHFSPASVLVNDTGDIIYISGRTGKYLEPVAGKANWNIYAMAREGLREVLPGALRKAIQNFDRVMLHRIKVTLNDGFQYVDVTVQRLQNSDSMKGLILFVFTDVHASAHEPVGHKREKSAPMVQQKELEMNLQRSYEDLQTLQEEMQTSQEEQKSTNEELQSTNEELQSTNEELTTSKEEMQSLNDELQTINTELQSKVSDFLLANNDMKNLLNSTEIATLFLDRELNIRRFTESTTSIIKLRNSDLGRPFTDLANDLKYPEMESHATRVLQTLVTKETTIATKDGRWFTIRMMPYRTVDDRVDGLVITFTDISTAKNLEREVKMKNDLLAVSETRYRRLFESAKEGILILQFETGKILDVNPFLISILGYSKKEFIEKAIWEIGFFKDLVANQEKFLELQQEEIIRYDELPLETASGKTIRVEFISNVYLENNQKVIQCSIRENK